MNERTYTTSVGATLRARRRLLGLNQTEVAELAGTTQRTVSQVEAGKASRLDLYAAVAEVLGLVLTVVPRDQVPRQAPGRGSRNSTAAEQAAAGETP
jgi:HTH-type transcriptional regulator/antitoxin HipB